MATLFVVVATVGRAELTRRTIALLDQQTRRPDRILVVGAQQSDIEGVGEVALNVTVALTTKGSCRQRNHAMDLIDGRADIVTFFDDDFIPSINYLEEVENIFEDREDIVGITGNLIADGIHSNGFSFEKALELVSATPVIVGPQRLRQALYGCNMSVRMSAACDLRFDEALPQYGWLEDVDFTMQLGRRGIMISDSRVTGVHMGFKSGRTSGKKFGYSQVANYFYLRKKGTMQPKLGLKLLINNILSNAARSFWPEPHVDRKGRLWGNVLAMTDLIRGRMDPRRIETM